MVISPSDEVWIDDDSGKARNARLLIESTQIGQWHVVATSYTANKEGSFRIGVEEIEERVRPIRLLPEQNPEKLIAMAYPFQLRALGRSYNSYGSSSSHGLSVRNGGISRLEETDHKNFNSINRYLEHRDRLYEERFDRLTVLMERQMRLHEAHSRALEQQLVLLENKISSVRTGRPEDTQFPWPPPQASALTVVPRSLLLEDGGKPLATLDQVNSRLSESLEQCGYQEKRYYAAPNGFALVTRIEQIDSEGRPKEPRWSVEIGTLHSFTLGAYLKALFMAPRGHFRVIAFVVTSQPFVTSGGPLTRKEADQWLVGGLNTLPSSIGESNFTQNHRVTVLIYEFEKQGHEGDVNFLVPGKFQGETHLRRSGLLTAIGNGGYKCP